MKYIFRNFENIVPTCLLDFKIYNNIYGTPEVQIILLGCISVKSGNYCYSSLIIRLRQEGELFEIPINAISAISARFERALIAWGSSDVSIPNFTLSHTSQVIIISAVN